MTNQERFDIHQHITDQIVAAIERGAGEFRLPWHRSAGNIMRPINIASKKPYRGVNVFEEGGEGRLHCLLRVIAESSRKSTLSGVEQSARGLRKGERSSGAPVSLIPALANSGLPELPEWDRKPQLRCSASISP
jgi:antirestriction protein ArdC